MHIAEATGENPARLGLHHVSIAPYGAYRSSGEDEVLLAIQNEREWRAFCEVVLEHPQAAADPRFKDNPARVANRETLDSLIASRFSKMTLSDILVRLERASVAFGAVNSVLDFAGHPHLRRMTVQTPDGQVSIPRPAAVLGDTSLDPGPVPSIGQHSDAIRAEFGSPARG